MGFYKTKQVKSILLSNLAAAFIQNILQCHVINASIRDISAQRGHAAEWDDSRSQTLGVIPPHHETILPVESVGLYKRHVGGKYENSRSHLHPRLICASHRKLRHHKECESTSSQRLLDLRDWGGDGGGGCPCLLGMNVLSRKQVILVWDGGKGAKGIKCVICSRNIFI